MGGCRSGRMINIGDLLQCVCERVYQSSCGVQRLMLSRTGSERVDNVGEISERC